MSNAIRTILTSTPPIVLFLGGVLSVLAFALAQLAAYLPPAQ